MTTKDHSLRLTMTVARNSPIVNATLPRTDHARLASLLEKLTRICARMHDGATSCDICPAEQVEHCGSSFRSLAGALTLTLVTHIAEEEERMLDLPRTREVTEHCEFHRREHLRFSTNYNLAVIQLDPGNLVESARQLSAFLSTWIRRHAMEFDTELDAIFLRHACRDTRYLAAGTTRETSP